MHCKTLGDKGSHTVAEQRYRQVGESRRQEFMDDERICDEQLPTVPRRKETGCIAMTAMTTMVVYCNGEASTDRCCGKSGVAIPVLAEAMNNLYDALCRVGWKPKLNMNLVPVFAIQHPAFVLRPSHSAAIISGLRANILYCMSDSLQPNSPCERKMIDLYYWPTPNGRKISIMLEECVLDYTPIAVDIRSGDQFDPEFLKISPNNRMPAIVDHETGISVFEGGAILVYLAEKTGQFLPQDAVGRFEVLQWLFWQAGGLGPMAGQLSHFVSYARDSVPYAHERFSNEYDRLLAVMDVRLRDREYLAGNYSIADIAAFPWVMPYHRLGNDLDRFPELRRWFDALKSRPAVRRGTDLGDDWQRTERSSEKAHAIMFSQNSETVYRAVDGPHDQTENPK